MTEDREPVARLARSLMNHVVAWANDDETAAAALTELSSSARAA